MSAQHNPEPTRGRASDALIVGQHLFKVFGNRPDSALDLLDQGLDKDQVFERTQQTIGIQDANLEVYPGEIFVVMGLSGSGKSTLLRLLNRLIEPTSGRVTIGGHDVTGMNKKDLIELRRRELSMVFQSFALMPHLKVWENVAFGLDVAGVSRKRRRESAQSALELVGLAAYAGSYPDELSGGMQQRVGLARALAAEPKILLMDEAFSALDPLIRMGMQDELLALQKSQGLTVVFVSHDLDEAMRVGDRIAIMEGGRILQVGTAEEILAAPADEYVRSFFRNVDLSAVLVARDMAVRDAVAIVGPADSQETALAVLRSEGRQLGCICDRDRRLLGIVSADSLSAAQRSSSKVLDAAHLDVEPVKDSAPFDEVVRRLAKAQMALPVVDAGGRLLGAITKTRLLEILAKRGHP